MALSAKKRILLWILPGAAILVAGVVVCVLAFRNGGQFENYPVNEDPKGYILRHVTIVHRHGVRAPTHLSNWSNVEDYPHGLGYLTAKGKQGSLQVGEILRAFYKNFLTDSPREVWARVSTYPRCYETEYLLLSTLYPPKGIWDFGYPVQPIPITMVPAGNDVLIESCGAEPYKDFIQGERLRDKFPELSDDGFADMGAFLQWLQSVSGLSTNNTDFYLPLIDALYAQKYNGLEIPAWAERKWKSIDWAMRRFSLMYWLRDLPYYGQYMARTIANRTSEAVTKDSLQRLSILSYHDTTIQALIQAFKLDAVKKYPSFLAAFHFQLYEKKSNGEYFVRTLYSQGFDVSGKYREATEFAIPECPFPECSFNMFIDLMNRAYSSVDRKQCPPIDTTALL